MSLERFEVCSAHVNITSGSLTSIVRQTELVIVNAQKMIVNSYDQTQSSQQMKEFIAKVDELKVALNVLRNDYEHNSSWEEFIISEEFVNEALITLENSLCDIYMLQNFCFDEVGSFKQALLEAKQITKQSLDDLSKFVNNVADDYLTACTELRMIKIHEYETLMNGIKIYMKSMQAPLAVFDTATPPCSSGDLINTAAISSVGTFLLSMALIHLAPRYTRKMQSVACNMFAMFHRNNSEFAVPAERVVLTDKYASDVELSDSQRHRA